jgi:hypothetical protein
MTISDMPFRVVRFDNGTTLQLVTFEIQRRRIGINATIVAYASAEESMFVPSSVGKITLDTYSALTAAPLLLARWEITEITSLTSEWVMPNEMALDNLPRVTYFVTAGLIEGGKLL